MIEAPLGKKSGVHSGAMERQTPTELPGFLRPDPLSMPGVALVGLAGTGKSTLAAWLAEEYRYRRHSWADGVRTVAALAYGPIDKAASYAVRLDGVRVSVTGRWLLQHLGTEAVRDQVDSDFWIKAGLRRMEPGRRYVNDDTRFPNEAAALRERGFVVVRVTAPAGVRAARLGVTVEQLAEQDAHASESHQEAIGADLELSAVGPIEGYGVDLVGWMRRRAAA